MNGEVLQLITIVNYGNAFLEGKPLKDGFYPEHFAFGGTKEIIFIDNESEGEKMYAADPRKWFERLKDEKYRKLLLRYIPTKGTDSSEEEVNDRVLAGFVGGGGTWLIEAIRGSDSDYWIGKWEVKQTEGAYDDAPWLVRYEKLPKEFSLPIYEAVPLKSIEKKMKLVLAPLRDLANRTDWKNFGEMFNNALEVFEMDEAATPGFIYLDSLSKEAIKLLVACSAAHVFGGMGSWNDVSFATLEDSKEYRELSDELYPLMQTAIEAAVNSQE